MAKKKYFLWRFSLTGWTTLLKAANNRVLAWGIVPSIGRWGLMIAVIKQERV